MPARVNEKESRQIDSNTFLVTMEGDRRDDLTHPHVRQQAIKYATSKNFPAFGIAPERQVVPINFEGKTTEELLQNKEKIAAWRCALRVCARMGPS